MLGRAVAVVACSCLALASAHAQPAPIEPLPPGMPPPSAAPLPPPASTATRPVYVPVYGAPAGPQLAPPADTDREYGWKILVSDGAAVGVVLLAIAIESPQRNDDTILSGADALAILGVAWWWNGTPLMHLTEGNLGGAALSWGARATLPLVGALVGHAFDREGSTTDTGALYGIFAGAAVASIIDATQLAKRPARHSTGWIPGFVVSPSGFRIGLGRAL